jgi:phosphoribosylformimino-5-aminoimidazole carboxamide ribotide isomerase
MHPVDMARLYEQYGAEWIHIVDLDAAKSSERNNLDTIFAIAKNTSLKIQMGGGIRNEALLQRVFDHGVTRAIIGSKAVKQPLLVYDWINKYGGDKIVIGTDVNNEYLATEGWLETSDTHIDDFIKAYRSRGGKIFLCTDIAKDGMLQGISIDLYKRLMTTHQDIKLIASGGVATMDDIKNAKDAGMYATIVGKAIYEKRIKLEDLFSAEK